MAYCQFCGKDTFGECQCKSRKRWLCDEALKDAIRMIASDAITHQTHAQRNRTAAVVVDLLEYVRRHTDDIPF